jgi:LemA protein
MSRAALRRARIPLFIVLAGLLLTGCGVNNIPTYDESAKAKWSDVQNQYQGRAGLIPNLVEAGARSPAWPGALPSPRM